MEYGQGSGAVGSSQEWECPCRGKNTVSKGQEEWPSCKVGASKYSFAFVSFQINSTLSHMAFLLQIVLSFRFTISKSPIPFMFLEK